MYVSSRFHTLYIVLVRWQPTLAYIIKQMEWTSNQACDSSINIIPDLSHGA